MFFKFMYAILHCDENQVIVRSEGTVHKIFQEDVLGKHITKYMTPFIAEFHKRMFVYLKRRSNFTMSNANRFVLLNAKAEPFMCDVHVDMTENNSVVSIENVSYSLSIHDTIPASYQKFIGESPGRIHLEECDVTCVVMDLSNSTSFVVKHGGTEFAGVLSQLYKIVTNHVVHMYPFVYVHELLGDSVFLVVNAPFMIKHPYGNNTELALNVSKQIQGSVDSLLQDTDMHLRVGIAHGPVSAGVIDGRSFRLFGPTVHLAQRLESVCPKKTITLNDSAVEQLPHTYPLQRHACTLKGFGNVDYFCYRN
jgi:class 3 adenylate cyclase